MNFIESTETIKYISLKNEEKKYDVGISTTTYTDKDITSNFDELVIYLNSKTHPNNNEIVDKLRENLNWQYKILSKTQYRLSTLNDGFYRGYLRIDESFIVKYESKEQLLEDVYWTLNMIIE